jgi:serine protease Do
MSSSLTLLRQPARILTLALLLGLMATPAALAKDGAFLGISSHSVSGDDARRYDLDSRDGAIIDQVYENTAAERAGLQRRDIILTFDGEKVYDDTDLTHMIRDRPAGDTVSLGIVRKGKPMTLSATLGNHDEWDDEDAGFSGLIRSVFGGDHHGTPTLGVHVMELNAQLAEYFEVGDEVGILVTQVVRRSPAETAGIAAGDVIVRVAGSRVLRSGEIGDSLEGREGETVTVDVIRKGSRREISVQLED